MILLVHGGWHGAWAWQFVLEHLAALSMPATAIDLPGHGLNTADFFSVTLQSYVDTVITHVRAAPCPVILVGHSMAGMIISQVAEQCPDAVRHLVYVSGFVPDMNGSLVDETAQFSTDKFAKQLFFDIKNCRISLKNMAHPERIFYTRTPADRIIWALPQLQDQPLKPFTQSVSLTPQRFGSVPKTYIMCTLDQSIPLIDQHRMRSKIMCDEVSLPTDHSPFLSMPGELAAILEELFRRAITRPIPTTITAPMQAHTGITAKADV